jgi:predicted nucleic acid-binding Zn ribbon protein
VPEQQHQSGASASGAQGASGQRASGQSAGKAAGDQPGQQPGQQAGPALARAALEAALARRRMPPPRQGGGRGGAGGARFGKRGYTGPGPDPRDPQPLATVLERLVKARGWQRPKAEATVFGAWERVVGAEVAAHSRPVKLEDRELTIEAESTAWATQLRLLAKRLLANIAAEVGRDVVVRLHIHGPAAPSWSRGPRRVRGRGPRDTYG